MDSFLVHTTLNTPQGLCSSSFPYLRHPSPKKATWLILSRPSSFYLNLTFPTKPTLAPLLNVASSFSLTPKALDFPYMLFHFIHTHHLLTYYTI